jgi:amidase
VKSPTAAEILSKSAAEMARRVRAKEISSTELIEAHVARIRQVNPKLNAVVQLAAERALEEARQADESLARGTIRGPLHGVPVTFKDAIETEGIISTGGTAGRARFVPNRDAEVVQRLRRAGAIVLAKTNCPELGWAWESDNLIYGRTNNPYDLSLSPGGSSGGESAMIAACGSPLGLGSDAGGSVRFPAHCTGIASIKPTSGRVPRTGHFPGPGGTLDAFWQIGPLARHVEDLELALRVISGPDAGDPAVAPVPLCESGAVDLKKLHVAFHVQNGIAKPEPAIAEAVRKAAHAILEAGAAVEEKRPPRIVETNEIFKSLFCADGGAGLEALLQSAGTAKLHPLMERVLKLQRENGLDIAQYGNLVGRWDSFRAAMLGFMQEFDAILCPVTSIVKMEHGSTFDRLDSFSYTMAFNLTGWPAAVVRAGVTPDGLPVGVQIAARPWREDVALAIARHLETALGGWQTAQI